MKVLRVTPVVPCSRLENSVRFYEDVLEFDVEALTETYALLSRDAVAIRLVEQAWDINPGQALPLREFYLDVDDIEAVFAAMRPKLSKLPVGRVRPPFDQDYGQREFHVTDPDVTRIVLGEPIAAVRMKKGTIL